MLRASLSIAVAAVVSAQTGSRSGTPSTSSSPSSSSSTSGSPTPSLTPTPSSSAGWCPLTYPANYEEGDPLPRSLTAIIVDQYEGSYSGIIDDDSYYFDSLSCADEMAGYDNGDQMKTVVLALTLGITPAFLPDVTSTEFGSGGTLVISTCNADTQWDTQLLVGTGCPIRGNDAAFSCQMSNDDVPLDPARRWDCGAGQSRVEIPLVASNASSLSVFSRFLIALAPYGDVPPGTPYTIEWSWIYPEPPMPEETPLPTDTPLETASQSEGATPSRTGSNSPTDTPSSSSSASETPTWSRTASKSRSFSRSATRTRNTSPSVTVTTSPSEDFTPSRTRSRSKTATPTRSSSGSPSGSETPSNSPTPSFTPSPTPSPGSCAFENELPADWEEGDPLPRRLVAWVADSWEGSVSGTFTSATSSYYFDELTCADEGAGYELGDQKKTQVFSLTLGLDAVLFDDPTSTVPGSGGSLVVDTCNAATNFDSMLFVGTGCPVPAESSWAFGCVASNDDAGYDGAGTYECGERARVVLPLTASNATAASAFSRFLVAVAPFADVRSGTTWTVSWTWLAPGESATPSPSATPRATASLTVGASPSRSGSNSPSPSGSPSGSSSDSPSFSATRTASRSFSRTATRTRNSSPSITATATPSQDFTPSRTRTRSRSCTPTATPTASASASRTPSQTPTISVTPSTSPSPGWCANLHPNVAGSFASQRSGVFQGAFTADSYWYDQMADCASGDGYFGESTKTVMFAVTLGLTDADFREPESLELGSGGTLVVDTCNARTRFDSQLFVGTGCAIPGEDRLFGCIASNDDGGYSPGGKWDCGDQSVVEIPLVASRASPVSARSRFLVAVAPFGDTNPGRSFNATWSWIAPSVSSTPSPSQTASSTASLTVGASPSRSGSNTPSPSGSPSASASDSNSRSQSRAPTVSPRATVSRTRNVSPTVSPSTCFSEDELDCAPPSSSRTLSRSFTSSVTGTGTQTRTGSPTPTLSRTASPTGTRSRTGTGSVSGTQTSTPSISESRTQTLSPGASRSETASRTETPSASQTGSNTRTQTGTQTSTRTQTATGTGTRTPTRTRTSTPSQTPSSTNTGTSSLTAGASRSQTASRTMTSSLTGSKSGTPSSSGTRSVTPSPSGSRTNTPSGSASKTPRTPSSTRTASITPSKSRKPKEAAFIRGVNGRK